MYLFHGYIEPLIEWLTLHPYWAISFAFFISLLESLAIIGSLIPGSVTMTAIGILAGSGVMRIDLTLMAAVLGAIIGDGLSYFLGYFYSESLHSVWPLRKYPGLLTHGRNYFNCHGGKSVLIGRFIGPLRSIIPVIAGMIHMNHWRFFAFNAASAIIWSALYVLPGILIGLASSDLSSEGSTRLFAFILMVLLSLWLLGFMLKWLVQRIGAFTQNHLRAFGERLLKNAYLSSLLQSLRADKREQLIFIYLSVLTILALLAFVGLSLLVIQSSLIAYLNHPIYLFLQSMRMALFDIFFLVFLQVSSIWTLSLVFFAILALSAYQRDWRRCKFWLSLHLSSLVLLFILHFWIKSPPPMMGLGAFWGNTYPAFYLSFASLQLTSLFLYVGHDTPSPYRIFLNLAFTFILLINGFGLVYLGAHWFSDVIGAYLFGFCLSSIHYLIYSSKEEAKINSPWFSVSLLLGLIVFVLFSLYANFKQEIKKYQPVSTQYIFSENVWWDEGNPAVTAFGRNRLGKDIALLNVQYVGNLEQLKKTLTVFGWQAQKPSFLSSLLKKINGEGWGLHVPAELYLNQKPALIMTFQPKKGGALQILRLWPSNYHLKRLMIEPIWLGSVSSLYSNAAKTSEARRSSFTYLQMALPFFKFKIKALSKKLPEHLAGSYEACILLIKEPEAKDFMGAFKGRL